MISIKNEMMSHSKTQNDLYKKKRMVWMFSFFASNSTHEVVNYLQKAGDREIQCFQNKSL